MTHQFTMKHFFTKWVLGNTVLDGSSVPYDTTVNKIQHFFRSIVNRTQKKKIKEVFQITAMVQRSKIRNIIEGWNSTWKTFTNGGRRMSENFLYVITTKVPNIPCRILFKVRTSVHIYTDEDQQYIRHSRH